VFAVEKFIAVGLYFKVNFRPILPRADALRKRTAALLICRHERYLHIRRERGGEHYSSDTH
jgi:hypothetical protein